jgi:hypothetical protein
LQPSIARLTLSSFCVGRWALATVTTTQGINESPSQIEE